MKAKLDRWESYTDQAGRQHWRWPATDQQVDISPRAESGSREKIGTPTLPPRWPMRPKDK